MSDETALSDRSVIVHPSPFGFSRPSTLVCCRYRPWLASPRGMGRR